MESVIQVNQQSYGTEKVSFVLRESTEAPLPTADLFIAKEVLQHLPSADVHSILALASNYRYAIFVNDIAHQRRAGWQRGWRWQDVSEVNIDVEAGGYRLLSLRDAPFRLDARQALTYENRYRNLRWTKEVLVIEHDDW